MSKLNIEEIVELTDGELAGSSDIAITGANTLECAEKGDITFLANPKYTKWVDKTKASCIIVPRGFGSSSDTALLKVDDPVLSFAKVLTRLYGEKAHPVKGISKKAQIHETASIGSGTSIGDFVKIEQGARIGTDCVIYPGAYIGKDAVISDKCLIYPNVSILNSVKIGKRVIIHSGSVIGSDGFGYFTENGRHEKVPQVGSVTISDDVEIGANVCIDRGSPGDTVIGSGTKIDNLVQIAHNVRIGKNCMIVSQVGIAGSTVVEDDVVLAGQAGVVGHITIGRGAKIGAQAGVTRDVKPNQLVSGYPAMNHSQAKRINALIRKLPRLFKEVEALSKKTGG
jgi:UDP-3-O-[3-hydroxymyristoyl] glucosamine N-acyltransferase